jgi:hypothetical protein
MKVGRWHAAATRHKTKNGGVFLELLAQADSEAHRCSFHCPVFVFAPGIIQESIYHWLSHFASCIQYSRF